MTTRHEYASSPQCGSAEKEADVEAVIYNGFVQKVLGIVATQLFATALIIGAILSSHSVARMALNAGTIQVALLVSTVTHMALATSRDLAMRVPINYALLAVFTVSDAIVASVPCYTTAKVAGTEILFQAAILTCAIVVGLTLICTRSQKRLDFVRGAQVVVSTGSMAMLCFTLGSWFLGYRTPFQHIVVAACGAMVFAAALLVDIDRMVKGGQVKLNEDHYVLAAICLYTDVVRLFVYLARLIRDAAKR
eukprot:Selendium_serpulae@DN5627_c1_g1_i10.p1